ncbi:MAG TPA: 50S ribosomal protein L13 [Candidatus Saccharimonadales bacterium]|nr:50S ribosomal protein L13 [Candidatus Saccharimonadales bacterium]
MITFHPKQKEVKRGWQLFDAKDKVLGRLSTDIAMTLMGKKKRDYSPHMDNGDNVVVVNAAFIKVTGKKEEQKKYYRHSGYPGGFKEISYKQMKATHPERILELAVKRMLPTNRLRDKRMNRLFISLDETNPKEGKFK